MPPLSPSERLAALRAGAPPDNPYISRELLQVLARQAQARNAPHRPATPPRHPLGDLRGEPPPLPKRPPAASDGRPNRAGLTAEQLDQRDRARAASHRNAPYLAVTPVTGMTLGAGIAAAPVVGGAAALGGRALAEAANAGLGKANKEIVKEVIKRQIRPGHVVRRSDDGGYKFTPPGQKPHHAQEVVRLSPGKNSSYPSQQKVIREGDAEERVRGHRRQTHRGAERQQAEPYGGGPHACVAVDLERAEEPTERIK